MSSVIAHKRDANGRVTSYRARYRTPDGKSRSKNFVLKKDAETFLASVEHRKLVGDYIDPRAAKITFGEYSATWLERKCSTTRPGTSNFFASHLRKHLEPRFGAFALGDITREMVKQFAADLGHLVAPTTARSIVFTLRAVLSEAVDDSRIARNPAERITVGDRTERRVDPMHIASVSTKVPVLAEAMPQRWSAAVLLMASTGLRLGECLGLTIDRVDFLRRTIRIDRQLQRDADGVLGFSDPKTRAGVRTIPVPQAVIDLLAAHLVQFPANGEGLIFTTEAGRFIPRNSWSDRYRQACKVAEVSGRTRSHDLRHVAASSLISGGLSVAAVQATLGHASPAETLEVYTHLWPTDEGRTRDAIEQASAGWLRARG